MIQANELRIGNWVIFEGENIKVLAGDIHYCEENLDSMEGIPLTPEILEKAGFKQARGSYRMFWRLMKIEIRYFDSGMVKFIINSSHHVEIKSLHQLQNLYFVLIGEELNIQL